MPDYFTFRNCYFRKISFIMIAQVADLEETGCQFQGNFEDIKCRTLQIKPF